MQSLGWSPYKKGEFGHRDRPHTGRIKPWKDENKDGIVHLQVKQHQKWLANPPETGGGAWHRVSLTALRRNLPVNTSGLQAVKLYIASQPCSLRSLVIAVLGSKYTRK